MHALISIKDGQNSSPSPNLEDKKHKIQYNYKTNNYYPYQFMYNICHFCDLNI